MDLSDALLSGLSDAHIERLEDGTMLHRDVVPAFLRLRDAAAKDGIALKVASGFRTYEAQLRIWNDKCDGRRVLLDAKGNPLDPSALSPRETVHAILRWSALPGASRHHWGTDFDVFDAAAVPEGYRVQLVPQEIQPGGVFARLGKWLETELASHGFFRPYQNDLGGVSPEWWHLSHASLAGACYDAFTLEKMRAAVEASPMRLQDIVLGELPEIYRRYVRNITLPAIG